MQTSTCINLTSTIRRPPMPAMQHFLSSLQAASELAALPPEETAAWFELQHGLWKVGSSRHVLLLLCCCYYAASMLAHYHQAPSLACKHGLHDPQHAWLCRAA